MAGAHTGRQSPHRVTGHRSRRTTKVSYGDGTFGLPMVSRVCKMAARNRSTRRRRDRQEGFMDTLVTLRSMVAGEVVGPGDRGFDDSRAVWNAMVDRRPAAIVRAADVTDIAPTIEAAGTLRL